MSAIERAASTESEIVVTLPDATASPPAGSRPGKEITRVVLTGLRVPFWSLVWFFVKAVIAAVPAVLILAMIAGAVVAAGIQLLGWFGGLSLARLLGLW